MAKTDITAQRLRELLDYDPATGVFTWRPRDPHTFKSRKACVIWNKRCCGKPAGSRNKALKYVSILGYLAHRLAWLHAHGVWPRAEIDHINGDHSDNRIANLRDVSRGINQQNIRVSMPRKVGVGLPLGVTLCARKRERRYVASIRVGAKRRHLGYFDTPELAYAAYLSAKRIHHQGCTL